MFDEIIKKLGLDISEFEQWANKTTLFRLHQLRRKIRYKCFAMARGNNENIPKKFIDHYEAQPHFSGWELFADRWDVTKEDPSITYPRLFSVDEEWEAELRLAVPDLLTAKSYRQTF